MARSLVGGVALLDDAQHPPSPFFDGAIGRRARSRWGRRARCWSAWPRSRWRRAWPPAASSVSGRSSGVSPGRTTTVESSSRSSPGIAVMPTIAASPVPRWTVCSTNVTLAQAGACSCTFLVTRSAPWPTTTTVRSTCDQFERVDDVHHHRPGRRSCAAAWAAPSASASPRRRRGRSRKRSCATFYRTGRAIVACTGERPAAPGRGLEPLYAAPKPAVLPLNDPGRNGPEATAAVAAGLRHVARHLASVGSFGMSVA